MLKHHGRASRSDVGGCYHLISVGKADCPAERPWVACHVERRANQYAAVVYFQVAARFPAKNGTAPTAKATAGIITTME